MNYRLTAFALCLILGFSLVGCNSSPGPSLLNGTKTEYSQTIAYATTAWGGVEILESEEGHILKNQTAQLNFGADQNGLSELTSLQTGETVLQNTVVTKLTMNNGTVTEITGGAETVDPGYYGIGHRRTGEAIRVPGDPTEATLLNAYDLTEKNGRAAFSALTNQLTAETTETGLKFTSEGDSRAQFGARYLDVDLGEYDHYYLSVTLRSQGISGLSCFFSTDSVPLTEDTLLGTLSLSQTGEEWITLTAEIQHTHWKGALQTLLFRLPEGETGSVEISRIALLTVNDRLDEGVSDTVWTVYSDGIYFSQSLSLEQGVYASCATEIRLNAAKCREVTESEHAIAIRLIDGSVFGIVRPTEGATVRVERTETEVLLLFDWDLTAQAPLLAFRMYLNYTETTDELEALAKQERTPLSAEDFTLEGAEFDRYDVRGGIYRLTLTGETVSVSVPKSNRTLYIYLKPAEGTAWKLCDKNGIRLPIFAGETFPLCPAERSLTVNLSPEARAETADLPTFFEASGLIPISNSVTVANGLCSQQTAVYGAPDASYAVTLTTTRLKDGIGTIYDIQYDFRGRKQVSDVLNKFPFFSFELTYGFEQYFYRNGEEETISVPAGSEPVSYLGSMPYLGLSADTESAGWLVTKSNMTVGGERSTALLCLRYEEMSEHQPNRLYLSYDLGETEFVRGDTLTVQVIRLDGEMGTEDRLLCLRSAGNFRIIQTEQKSVGTLTAMGMEETVILQLEGFEDYSFPKLTANGAPFTPEKYHVYVDRNGYYGFAFAVPRGTEISVE